MRSGYVRYVVGVVWALYLTWWHRCTSVRFGHGALTLRTGYTIVISLRGLTGAFILASYLPAEARARCVHDGRDSSAYRTLLRPSAALRENRPCEGEGSRSVSRGSAAGRFGVI